MKKIIYLLVVLSVTLPLTDLSAAEEGVTVALVDDGGGIAYDSESGEMYVQKPNGRYVVFNANENPEAADEVITAAEKGKTTFPPAGTEVSESGKVDQKKNGFWQKVKNIFKKKKDDGFMAEMDDEEMEKWLRGGSDHGPIIFIPYGQPPRTINRFRI